MTEFAVVILNWEELGVVRESLKALKDEPDTEIVVVDNGSLDLSRPFLAGAGVRSVLLEANRGISYARNVGIAATRAPFVMLLDGDIRYVPGSLATFKRVLDANPNFGCVGVYGREANTQDRSQAHVRFDTYDHLATDFPIAWTQYGLFRREVLITCPFDETDYFSLPGHGFEDDDLYHQMRAQGWTSAYMTGLKYYHEQSTGIKKLKEYCLPTYHDEREAQFRAKWGL